MAEELIGNGVRSNSAGITQLDNSQIELNKIPGPNYSRCTNATQRYIYYQYKLFLFPLLRAALLFLTIFF